MTWILALGMLLTSAFASANGGSRERALEIEPSVYGFPERSARELAALVPQAQGASAPDRRLLLGLYAQAQILSGNIAGAATLLHGLEAEASTANDAATRATSLLIRGAIESASGDGAKAIALAREARDVARSSDDRFVQYWAALALGTSARTRGQPEEALASLQEALSLAEQAGNAYRRSSAYYQLAVLHLALKNAPASLAASQSAFRDGEAARSVFAMANARMAESAVMEMLERPARELAAMEEALAIAQQARSQVAEGRALVNLGDIRLRRRQYAEALDLARSALRVANTTANRTLAAAAKANVGFALLGLGRIQDGKRFTDEALAEYERTGATAEIAELIGEYGRNLEQLGDFKGALALYHRERSLNDEIALQTRQRALYEMQAKYESEKRSGEIAQLNRENELKTAEIASRKQLQRVWWLLAGVFAASFAVVSLLYRKLHATNALLAAKNAELSIQSSRDPLTGLYNRRYFQQFIAAEGCQPERRRREDDGAVRALLLIDIDHFKETNDRYGHAVGDAVLVAVAQRLRETLRESDMIVRWGGEEFLVFATTTADTMDDIAARILNAISAQPITLRDNAIRTAASIGYLPMPLPPADVPLSWDRAIGLIDMALYMAKVNGRNRAYGIRRLVKSDAETLAAAERDLEHAVEAGLVEMHVLYGPMPGTQVTSEIRVPSGEDDLAPPVVPLPGSAH